MIYYPQPRSSLHVSAPAKFFLKWLLPLFLVLANSLVAGPGYSAEPGMNFSPHTISLPVELLKSGMFLVASRTLKDSRFSETVVLLVQYDEKSVLGLIVNQPTDTRLAAVLPGERLLRHREDPIYFGGPVESGNIFLLIRTDTPRDGTIRVLDGVFTSASPAVLQELLKTAYPHREFRAYAGYVGWLPEQLEREIARGDWHIMPADAETVFLPKPRAVWPGLISRAAHTWTKNVPPTSVPSPLRPPGKESIAEFAAVGRLGE